MSNNEFTIHDKGYFGVSFLDVDEYAANLVSLTVHNMVKRQNGVVFTDAQASYDLAHRALTVEGVATDLTDESVAINGLVGCTNAVRGLSGGKYPAAS